MASTYHEVLDLSEDASMNAVRTAYREKVKEYHPDISDHPDAKKRFQQLKSAYEVLSSRKRRERYERMGHNKYVDQYGGYSSDELEQTTEIQLVKQETQTNRAESNSKEEFANHDKQGSTRSEQNEVSKGTWISWIIQGRTSENDGTVPYIIRLSVYTILLLVGIFISKPIFGGSNALISNFPAFLILLCGARIVYLSVFEHLREEYVKIDQSPEPDSYAIPYALAFGLLGLTLPLFSLFPQVLGMSLETYPIALAIVLGVRLFSVLVIFPIGYMGIIMAVGWGVADDYYNLGYEVNPILWNFTVQLPTLAVIAAVTAGVPTPVVAMVALGTFIGGFSYLLAYHREVAWEVKWRIQNRTIFPT